MNKPKVDEIISFCREDKCLRKHIYDAVWISGCVTQVYPIGIHKDSIEIQIETDVNEYMLRGFKNRLENKFKSQVDSIHFWKTDGSCPSVLTIFLHKTH